MKWALDQDTKTRNPAAQRGITWRKLPEGRCWAGSRKIPGGCGLEQSGRRDGEGPGDRQHPWLSQEPNIRSAVLLLVMIYSTAAVTDNIPGSWFPL